MVKYVLEQWNNLKTPNEGYSYYEIKDFNIILIKTTENKLGLIITKTLPLPNNVKLKEFDITYAKEIVNSFKKSVYNRCQILVAKKNVDEDLLIAILLSIFELKDNNLDSFKLISIFENINKIFKLQSLQFNEIVGVWGELYFILFLLKLTRSDEKKREIIESWEGDIFRNKIDFQFNHLKIAIEVKTTIKHHRSHHIGGHKQCQCPTLMDKLFFLSTRISENENGLSCNSILKAIKNCITPSLIELLEERCKVRGKKYCTDTIHSFELLDSTYCKLYDSSIIELPSIPAGITEMQWIQNFDFIKESNKNESLNLIINYFSRD